MSYLKSDAIVVGRRPFRNTSLVVRYYTDRAGLWTAVAKGAFRRRRKAEPPSVPDLFERGEVVLYVRPPSDLAILREWTLDDMRAGLRRDYQAFRAAAGCAALVESLGRGSGPSADHFGALDRTLRELERDGSPRPVMWAFALKALARAGFLAPFDRCAACGTRLGSPGEEAVGLAPGRGGLLCTACHRSPDEAGGDGFVALPPAAAAAARFLAGAAPRAASNLRPSARAAAALERAVRRSAEYVLERPMPVLSPG